MYIFLFNSYFFCLSQNLKVPLPESIAGEMGKEKKLKYVS